jgi:hypothetical protein
MVALSFVSYPISSDVSFVVIVVDVVIGMLLYSLPEVPLHSTSALPMSMAAYQPYLDMQYSSWTCCTTVLYDLATILNRKL